MYSIQEGFGDFRRQYTLQKLLHCGLTAWLSLWGNWLTVFGFFSCRGRLAVSCSLFWRFRVVPKSTENGDSQLFQTIWDSSYIRRLENHPHTLWYVSNISGVTIQATWAVNKLHVYLKQLHIKHVHCRPKTVTLTHSNMLWLWLQHIFAMASSYKLQ